MALLLVAISFWLFASDSLVQKIVCLLFSLYFLFLLIKKYSANMQIIVLILLSFSLIAFLNKKTTNFNLNSQSQLTIYPDQLRVKDDFLSGTG
nr:DNA internalization-related competence protein ComEC/Rec2 [Lactobacillus amylovorus]